MKKLAVLASVAVLAVACSKESTQIVESKERIKVYSASELSSQIDQVNQPFTFETSGKATDLSYTLKAVAEPPLIGGGDLTYATSIHKVGNLVYVTWHTVDTVFGGAVSVYDVSSPEAVSYKGRIDFLDTDFHDGAFYNDGAGNNYFYVVGQHDRNNGVYEDDLAWFKGGIFGRISLKGADSTLTSTYAELPLAGNAGNSVAIGATNANMHVITGDGTSGVYRINGDAMTKIDSNLTYNDGEAIASDGSNFYAFFGDDNGTGGELVTYGISQKVSDGSSTAVSFTSEKVERNSMSVSGGVAYLAMGADGVITVNGGSVSQHANTYGGEARDVTVNGDTVYVANGETNMLVMDKSVTPWDLIGVRQGDGDYKEVLYKDGYLFIADAVNGFLIVKQEN